MQAASHKEDMVFETGSHPQSSQVQAQKTRSCHTNHNHHHHQLLKSSDITLPTASTSVPAVTPQTAFSSLSHTQVSEGPERKSRCDTTGELETLASEEPSSLRVCPSLGQRNGYGSSKSTSSPVPQPVLVRTYTPTESRSFSTANLSSPPPLAPTPALFSSASLLNFKTTLVSIRGRISAPSSAGRSSLASPSLLTQQKSQRYRQEQVLSSPAAAAVRSAMAESSRIPPVDAFTFENILRAVEPDIQPALNAIAEICSRSKLSLADEYAAHLPPQGEISASHHSTYPYRAGIGNGTGTSATITGGQDKTLSVVPEASSSSERLAGQQEHSSGPLTKHGTQMKRRSTGKNSTAEYGDSTKPKNDISTSPKAATEPTDKTNTTTTSATELPKFTQLLASPPEETNERSKRRTSITLLSSSTSEGTGPTAPTTIAVAKEITSSDNAATIIRAPIALSNDAFADNKPPKSSLSSWVFWGSSDRKSESQNRGGSFKHDAETKLNDILKGTGVTATHSTSTKK